MHVSVCAHICMRIHIIHTTIVLLYLNVQGSRFLTLEDGTVRLSRNVGKKLLLLAE